MCSKWVFFSRANVKYGTSSCGSAIGGAICCTSASGGASDGGGTSASSGVSASGGASASGGCQCQWWYVPIVVSSSGDVSGCQCQ